jgi:hypothetical protein
VHFVHSAACDAKKTSHDALTVGNGEFAFTADLTGLQSLNNTYTTPNSFPLYTMSNWGWHSPDPVGLGFEMFNGDGSLNYVYEQVQINSSDTRTGRGDRKVPYQFRCSEYNDQKLCDYMHRWPARINLGQLSFVLADQQPAPTPPPTPQPNMTNCTGLGQWCNTGAVDSKGSCRNIMQVASVPGTACNKTASCSPGKGWQDKPFCVRGNQITMTGKSRVLACCSQCHQTRCCSQCHQTRGGGTIHLVILLVLCYINVV